MAQVFNAAGNDETVLTATGAGRERTIGIKGVGDSGVIGEATSWCGLIGISASTTGGFGVYGKNTAGGTGVVGESDGWMGVYGKSLSTEGGAGVMGEATGPGVIGKSTTWMGVYGETQSTTGGAGVWGEHKAGGTGTVGKSTTGVGVWGTSDGHEGVHAETKSTTTAALAAFQLNPASDTAALFAKHEGGRTAAVFEGNVIVTGDISLPNADCAEDFTIADAEIVEAGAVMVLGRDGLLHECDQAHDKRVVGIISGAGEFKPGIVLDRTTHPNRRPIALLGKAFCKVDAKYGPIEVGDLLTTSPTSGHAMKVTEHPRAHGTVIGKALRSHSEGQGLIPVLIALQ
jgi:hypothetical protein